MDNTHDECILALVKSSLWGTPPPEINESIYEEMMQQAIAALPASIISNTRISAELLTKWENTILQQISYYANYKYQQANLPIDVPFVILKGLAASQYYPHPEYRTMGDIDIMTNHQDFYIAYSQLRNNGFQLKKNNSDREAVFVKGGLIVELHRRFASLNDPSQTKYLDTLIIDNINPTHILPDLINGLVILEHISQHLENGLGLRQIIDWMMFVDKCLTEEKWLEFEQMADKIGLQKLAITITRMCEIYLGLQEHIWCANADESLCGQLLEYVLKSGNFGNKRVADEDISENVFAYASTPQMIFKLLLERGIANWKSAQKYRIIRPVAWIYQAFRYFKRGLRRDEAFFKIRNEYKAAKQRNLMLNALGVKRKAKGIATYKDGEYIKS